jgi:hypothetical protein
VVTRSKEEELDPRMKIRMEEPERKETNKENERKEETNLNTKNNNLIRLARGSKIILLVFGVVDGMFGDAKRCESIHMFFYHALLCLLIMFRLA